MCSSSTGALEGHSTHLHVGRSDLHLPLDPPAGGLQMAHSFEHIPVLRDEVVSLFASVPPGVVVDATIGGGGHAAALLRGLRRPAHRRAGPRSRRPAGGPGAAVLVRGPRHVHCSALLHAGIRPLRARVRAPGRRAPRPGRQLPPARLVRAGVLVPRGRAARHADGSHQRPDGRRPGQHPAGGGPGDAVPAERRGEAVRAHRPGRRASPATDLDEAAGRSRGVGGAGAGPPQGSPGPAGVPGTAH